MHIRLRIYLMIAVITLLLGLPTNLTQVTGDAPNLTSTRVISYPADYPWASQYIQQELEPPRDVGDYISLGIRSFDNFLLASYYDSTNHALMTAAPVPNHAGNCGTDNNWFCGVLDGGVSDLGRYASSDFWGASLDNWKWGISYYDATNRALKAAIRACYFGDCSWTIGYVAVPDPAEDAVGIYSSFKFDANGNAGIASTYFDAQYNEYNLYYAVQVPSSGNCGFGDWAGLWECEDVIYIVGMQGMSLDYDSENTAYIAYYQIGGTLQLAIKGGLCGVEGGWDCFLLDNHATDTGYPKIIAAHTADDVFRIAYYDKTNGHLKYYQEDWGALIVDDVGAGSITPMGISMILDQDGNPVIAYRKVPHEFAAPKLSLARPADEYGLEYGNCGDTPPGYLFTYWQCIILDNGGQYTEEANYVSMVVNSNGLLGMAYTEFDSNYAVTSLKFTYQHFLRTYLPISRHE